MTRITNGKEKNGSLEAVLILFAIVTACSVSGYRGILNYISAFSTVLLIAISIGHSHGVIHLDCKNICIIVFMQYYVLSSLINLNLSNLIIYSLYNLVVFSPIIVASILLREQNKKYTIRTLRMIGIVWIVIGAITLATYIANPGIARFAAAYQEQYAGRIFGGYNYAYGSCLLLVYIFSNFVMNKIEKRMKATAFISCVFLFVIIYLTQSTLTTLASILGIIVCFFIDRQRNDTHPSNKIIKLIIFGFFITISYITIERNVDEIMAWVNLNSHHLFVYRIGEILRNAFYSDTTGHFAKRSTLILDSWRLFCQSPVFGWGYKYGNVFSAGKQMGIGNHSEILDILAKYGLIGGLPLLMLYFEAINTLLQKQYSGLIVSLIMLLLFNPFMSFDSFLILFLVIPLFEYLKDKIVDRV